MLGSLREIGHGVDRRLISTELCVHVIIADESLKFRCSLRALLKAAIFWRTHTC